MVTRSRAPHRGAGCREPRSAEFPGAEPKNWPSRRAAAGQRRGARWSRSVAKDYLEARTGGGILPTTASRPAALYSAEALRDGTLAPTSAASIKTANAMRAPTERVRREPFLGIVLRCRSACAQMGRSMHVGGHRPATHAATNKVCGPAREAASASKKKGLVISIVNAHQSHSARCGKRQCVMDRRVCGHHAGLLPDLVR